jgi:hypothetical protein
MMWVVKARNSSFAKSALSPVRDDAYVLCNQTLNLHLWMSEHLDSWTLHPICPLLYSEYIPPCYEITGVNILYSFLATFLWHLTWPWLHPDSRLLVLLCCSPIVPLPFITSFSHMYAPQFAYQLRYLSRPSLHEVVAVCDRCQLEHYTSDMISIPQTTSGLNTKIWGWTNWEGTAHNMKPSPFQSNPSSGPDLQLWCTLILQSIYSTELIKGPGSKSSQTQIPGVRCGQPDPISHFGNKVPCCGKRYKRLS